MARMVFNVRIECEVTTLEEGLAGAEDEQEREWVQKNAAAYPIPVEVLSVLCNGRSIDAEAEDYMEHRYILAGTGGDGYTLSVTQYIV